MDGSVLFSTFLSKYMLPCCYCHRVLQRDVNFRLSGKKGKGNDFANSGPSLSSSKSFFYSFPYEPPLRNSVSAGGSR